MKLIAEGKVLVGCWHGFIRFETAEQYMDAVLRRIVEVKYDPKTEEELCKAYRKEYEKSGMDWEGYWTEPEYEFWDPRVKEVNG